MLPRLAGWSGEDHDLIAADAAAADGEGGQTAEEPIVRIAVSRHLTPASEHYINGRMRTELRELRGALRRELDLGLPPWLKPRTASAVEDLSRRLGSSLHIATDPDVEGDATALARARDILELIRAYRGAHAAPRDATG